MGDWVRIYVHERYKGIPKPGPPGNDTVGGAAAGRRLLADAALDNHRNLPLTGSLQRAKAWGGMLKAGELAGEQPEEDGVQSAAAWGSLDAYLYGEQDGRASGANMYEKADRPRFVARVLGVVDRDTLILDRALNIDLKLHWKVRRWRLRPGCLASRQAAPPSLLPMPRSLQAGC